MYPSLGWGYMTNYIPGQNRNHTIPTIAIEQNGMGWDGIGWNGIECNINNRIQQNV